MNDLNSLQRLYAQTAPFYEGRVIPAFGPLAADLAAWAIACAAAQSAGQLHDPFDLPAPIALPHTLRALDVGTGTGILARTLARTIPDVTGVDLSLSMLGAGHGARFLNADIHRLPFRRGSFSLVVSTFGLNATNPKEALRSLARVLRPGGLLVFQEWGAQDDCTQLVEEILKKYMPEEIPGLDAEIMAYYDAPKPWYDQLQDAEDYYEKLKEMGFALAWAREKPFTTVTFPTVDGFLTYKLAWPVRRLAMEAMAPDVRHACLTEMRAALSPYLNVDGTLEWAPPLFRICAVR